jgi:endonuclease/exonuclease/phosphatase (EEP) superfamily protein YafD
MLKTLLIQLLKVAINFFWLGLWLFGLGLLLWYPMRWQPGDRFFPVQLLNYMMPWLLVGLIPGLTMAGLARRRRLAVALAIPTLLISFHLAPLFLPRPHLALANTTSIKVISFNMWGRNHNIEAIAELIHQEQPDLVLLQEFNWTTYKQLKARLNELYPDQWHIQPESSLRQGIISRFPLTPLPGSYDQGRIQKAIIHTPAGPIMVWNAHPYQPYYWSDHYDQITNLVEAMTEIKMPFILAGDFNTTDQSETYRLINRQLANAHWESGWGFGFSFPSSAAKIYKGYPMPFPLVRIDHIFYSSHFDAKSAGTLDTFVGSDHFPIVAELSLITVP